MKDRKIYKDEGLTSWDFISAIDAICPKCKGQGILLTPNSEQSVPEFKCRKCYFSKSGYEFSTFSKPQKILCENCEFVFELEIENLPLTVKKANAKCPDCKHSNQVVVEFDLYHKGGTFNSKSTDEYFGLKYWYEIRFKENCFWAYNLKHLNEIEAYVSSGLRKRHTGDYQSMVEKLPRWISDKKNRKSILKTIEKLKLKK